MGAAAVPIAIGLTAAATGYQISESRKARKEGQRQMAAQNERANQLMEEQRQQAQQQYDEQARMRAEEEARVSADSQRDQSRLRLKALAAQKAGRKGTILTGPTGLNNTPTSSKKTLLGG